jgi:hypothetical protein
MRQPLTDLSIDSDALINVVDAVQLDKDALHYVARVSSSKPRVTLPVVGRVGIRQACKA